MSDRINFYRSPVDRVLLRVLNKRSNVRGLLHSLAHLALYLATTAV